MKKEEKILVNEFFVLVLNFYLLFNSTDEKWQILPKCNTYLDRMIQVLKEISLDEEDFEKILLDIEAMIVMQRSDEDLLFKYKDFIFKMNS
jgi:hypothetical protein